jgi:hypothetical protein
MELNIYRDGSRNRIVKDNTKQDILYTIKAPCALLSNPPKTVLQGTQIQPIATITKSGCFHPTYTLELLPNSLRPSPVTVTILPPSRIFSSKSSFRYNGREYIWHSDKELSCEGRVIAVFQRKCFAWTKKGVLTIYGESEKMVDVIVLTGIAMQYRWEKTRNQRRAGAAGGGP